MTGRLGIDFGTSNTVIAVWDEARQEGVPLAIPGYSREVAYRVHAAADDPEERIAIIPSLIHYAQGNLHWIGEQVISHHCESSPWTFRWMKRYISQRSPVRINVGGRQISYLEAGREFLAAVLGFALSEVHQKDEEVALTVPIEAFEHYEAWLMETAESAGLARFRLIDEASAAAFGYGAGLRPGDVFLVFDFGGGTLDVSIVCLEEESENAGKKRCRVLGKAGAEIGGAAIDGWIYQHILSHSGKRESDDAIRRHSRALLLECERAKERLSFAESADIRFQSDPPGLSLTGKLTRGHLEELFDRHEVFRLIDQTIRRAMNAAQDRGYGDGDIRTVLMVGGSSLIPSVRKTLERIFGKERVTLRRPLDAVARGAAAFAAGVGLQDHIQHDYAVRHVDAAGAGYEFRVIVPRGTLYPTREPLARMIIKASYAGQTQLGLAIFELGSRTSVATQAPRLELVFDPEGSARLRRLTPDDEEARLHFWVNEDSPTFLRAEPPAQKGEARFDVEFGIDGNKRLLVTARDLKNGAVIFRDHPVIRLV